MTKLVKYYCDICKKELNSDEYYRDLRKTKKEKIEISGFLPFDLLSLFAYAFKTNKQKTFCVSCEKRLKKSLLKEIKKIESETE
jgi:hypothetical protein